MTEWDMYLLTRMDSLHVLFGILLGISLVLGVISSIVGLIAWDEHHENVASWCGRAAKWFLPIGAVMGLLLTLTPTTKEMVAIKVIPRIVNNQGVQDLGQDIVDLAKEYLRDEIQSLRKGAEAEQKK